MNYELLKLSKILPSIKGKKILEIYEESLERARQNYQQGEIASAQGPERKAGFHSNLRGALSNKNNRGREGASVDRLQKIEGLMNGYDNLRILMTGAEPPEKIAPLIEQTNFDSKKKRQSEDANKTQAPTPTSAHGNFVFRKKKLFLKNTTDSCNVTQTPFMKGFVVAEETTTLNGTKVAVNNQSQDIMVRHKKKYLKDLKQDPRRTFQNPRDINEPSTQKALGGMNPNSSVPELGGQDYNSKPSKMGTLVFDGTILQNPEPKKAQSTKYSSVKGIFRGNA